MADTIRPNILVVDDEEYVCSIIEESLNEQDYNVTVLTDPELALTHLREKPVDLVLSDLVMGEHSGVQVLDTALAEHPDAIVILMTAHPTVQTAISVLKKGAYDFLVKPFKLEVLNVTIQRGLEHQKIFRENLRLKEQVEFLRVANNCSAIKDLDTYLQQVARLCYNELSANAVGLLEVDPDSGELLRELNYGDDPALIEPVTDPQTLIQFGHTKSTQPIVTSDDHRGATGQSPRIFITQPIFVGRKLHGVINVLIRHRFDSVTKGQLDVLTLLGNSTASAIANYTLYRDLRSSYLQAIRGLANAIEARDAYTAGHTDRVCIIAEQIARYLGWDDQAIHNLIMGCTLHDIGKIGVPDSILNKPGRLDDDEQKMMMGHPDVGLRIIKDIDLFRPAIPYVSCHHERYDGQGYPGGLKAEEIPFEGRLLSVADTLDAILSDRPYREGASLEIALRELVGHAGTQFDPSIVTSLIEVIGLGRLDLKKMYGRDFDMSVVAEYLRNVTEKAPA